MENKSLKMILTAAISVSLLGNIVLFWQLKEQQGVNTRQTEEVAKNASEKLKKNSSEAAAEKSKLEEAIQEKDKEIAQLKQPDASQKAAQLTEEQQKVAETFAKIATDKSIDAEEMATQLKPVATPEVIQKLQSTNTKETDNQYGSYSFSLGDVQVFAQPKGEKEQWKFVAFVDYTIGNPQFRDVKPQKIKGGLTITEKQIDGQWQVTDFGYFTR
ncbi:hypothetical protein [Enterococcus faecium]|uniref:hypothetical protein n=1 Tax=Enterococcus faecium TaxID=1352 RepID=UPI00339170AA